MGHKISFKTTQDFVQGGLIENVDVELRNCRYEIWDYGGKSAKDTLAFCCDMHEIMKDGSVAEVPAAVGQKWSMGNPDELLPVEDGRYLEANHEGASLKKGSNFFVFYESLEKQGFSGTDGDAYAFNGLQIHIVRIPAPERSGLEPRGDGDRKPMVLIASALIHNPLEKKNQRGNTAVSRAAGNSSAKTAPAAAPASTQSNEDDTNTARDMAIELATGLIADGKIANGSALSAFRAGMIRAATAAKWAPNHRNAMNGLLKNNDELSLILQSAGADIDGDTVTVG